MRTTRLIRKLASSDKEVQSAAKAALIEMGASAVAPLIAELCNEKSAVEWSSTAHVLGQVGLPAFAPLVDVVDLHGNAEIRRSACFALSWLKLDDLTPYADVLRHPNPRVRAQAAYLLQCRGERSLPHAEALLELLADQDADVRQRAAWALPKLGQALIPRLQEIRRHGPGRLRAGALTALSDIAPDSIDDRDRRALHRLIEVKTRAEVPQPIHLCGSWLAVRASDQAAVLAALDLSDPTMVTMRMGESAWNHDHHAWDLDTDDHRTHGRVYVTPALDGWTLVFGNWTELAHQPDHDETGWAREVQRMCAQLSAVFGAAHLYGMSCGDGWTAWCLARNGVVERFYELEHDNHLGERHPAEAGYVLPGEDNGLPDDAYAGVDFSDTQAFMARRAQLKVQYGFPDTCYATDIAARTSVDPTSLGPQTPIAGRAILALTACGREHGVAPGALSI